MKRISLPVLIAPDLEAASAAAAMEASAGGGVYTAAHAAPGSTAAMVGIYLVAVYHGTADILFIICGYLEAGVCV